MGKRGSNEMRRKRMLYQLLGLIVGLSIGLVITRITGSDFQGEILLAGVGGWLALWIGEKKRELPTADDLSWARFKEGVNPLGLFSYDSMRDTGEKEVSGGSGKSGE